MEERERGMPRWKDSELEAIESCLTVLSSAQILIKES
jgi:hypothetical protein